MTGRPTLAKAAQDDLERLLPADWGEEVRVVGRGYLTVQVVTEEEIRQVGGATTVRGVLLIRTSQNFPTGTLIERAGVTYNIASREELDGLHTYGLNI